MLSNQAKIESLLFVSGNEGITARELSQLTGIMKPAVLEQLALIEKKYKQDANTAPKVDPCRRALSVGDQESCN